ncbi:MAG TPA: hypothetical protein VJB66_05135 [Candidatus Nanoarchaeia archaeon]|nr:hypothetical protein [Candidatus Nanoarchaeia archaeon]
MAIKKEDPIYSDIMKAVVAKDATRATEVDRVLLSYDGEPTILRRFLERAGTNDPWEAAQQFKIERVIFRSKFELEGDRYLGRSDSGHVLTDTLVRLRHNYDATRAWQTGIEATTKLLAAFGTPDQKEAVSAEGQERMRQRKKQREGELLRDFPKTLEEALADPNAAPQSMVDRRKVHAILGLDDAVKERLKYLDDAISGNPAFTIPGEKLYLVASDPGGQLFNWFKRQLKTLPTEIRDIYTMMTNPLIDVPEEDRKFMYGALVAYAAMNMRINKDAAIGHYLADMKELEKLGKDHPIVQKYGRPNLIDVKDVVDADEITLIDAARVAQRYRFRQARAELNEAWYKRFESEVDAVIKELKGYFAMDDGTLHSDALKSVPMGRLKETPYNSAITREDFQAVRDYIALQTLGRGQQQVIESTSIAGYRGLVADVVAAHRKIEYMRSRLAVIPKSLEEFGGIPKPAQRDMQKFRGKNFEIAEMFGHRYGMTREQLFDRAVELGVLGSMFSPESFELETQMERPGLYDTRILQEGRGQFTLNEVQKALKEGRVK